MLKKSEETFDSFIFFSFVFIVLFGIIFVTSSSLFIAEQKNLPTWFFVQKQYISIFLGFFAFLSLLSIPTHKIEKCSHLLLMAGIILLMLTLVPLFATKINGAKRWIRLAGFYIQPVEFLKLAWIVYLSTHIAKKPFAIIWRAEGFFTPLVLLAVMGVMLIMQPDFGSLAVLTIVSIIMFFLAGVKIRRFFILGVLSLVILAALLVISPYRLQRIVSFLNPWSDQYGAGYQLIQSLIAFGQGGAFGKGIGNSVQKFGYLPEAHTDFILSVIAEEIGIFGLVLLLVLFFVCIVKIYQYGAEALKLKLRFNGFLLHSIAILLFVEIVFNIGVCMGLFPTKGIAMPLVSYGGSAMISNMAFFGLALRAIYEINLYKSLNKNKI